MRVLPAHAHRQSNIQTWSQLLGAETIRHKDEGPPGKAFRAFALARWILDEAQERVIIPIFGLVCADLS